MQKACHSEPVRTLAWESVLLLQWKTDCRGSCRSLAMTSPGILQRALFVFYGALRLMTAISGRLKMRGTLPWPERPEVMIMRISSLSIMSP